MKICKQYFYIFRLCIFLIFCFACRQNSDLKNDIKNAIDQKIDLSMFKFVYKGDSVLPFNTFKDRYKFLSIVYLEDGCNPCYQKYIDWQIKVDSIKKNQNYSILFVIQGFKYKSFISRVKDIKKIDEHYFSTTDSDYQFLEKNPNIPRWIFDNSFLINAENKIKLIGAPWKSNDLAELYLQSTTDK